MPLRVPGLEGKVGLVTGGSSGIGRATCLCLARQGCRVVVHYRSGRERADDVVDRIIREGGEAVAIGGNLTRSDEIRSLVDAVARRYGRLDILVNNAGDPLRRAPFAEVDEATLDYVIALNLKGPFLLTQAALRLLQVLRGVVVNVSTSLTRRGSSGDNSHYVAAKGGLNTLTLALATELAPLGIRVNCVCPGVIDTELQQRLSTPERRQWSASKNLMKRLGTPEEIAAAIAFLASDAATFITGQVLFADGG